MNKRIAIACISSLLLFSSYSLVQAAPSVSPYKPPHRATPATPAEPGEPGEPATPAVPATPPRPHGTEDQEVQREADRAARAILREEREAEREARAERRGTSQSRPVLPSRTISLPGGRTVFVIVIQVVPSRRVWIDPVVAVGYDYAVEKGPGITSVMLPEGIGDNMYELWSFDPSQDAFVNSGVELTGGEEYTFPEPVSKFSIRGIEVSAELDPEDQMAFPTGLKFDKEGEAEVHMTAVTADTEDAGAEN